MNSSMRTMVLVASFAAACGSDTQKAHFTVDQTKPLNSLSASDIDAMCTEMLSAHKATFEKEDMCVLAASVLGAGEKCESTYTRCVQSTVDLWSNYDCWLRHPAVKTCAATVKDVEDCFNDNNQLMHDVLSNASCSTPPSKLPDDPPSCQRFTSICPSL